MNFFAFGRAPSEDDGKEEVSQLAYDTWEVVDRYRFRREVRFLFDSYL